MIRLDVYVSRGCANCEYARGLAAATAHAYPEIHVQVLELSQVADLPEEVFATPSYLLNGRVISLGNPDKERLFALLDQVLGAESS